MDEFFYACQKGYLATVSEELEKDPTLVCSHDAFGRTPLHYACCSGHVAVAQLLLRKGALVTVEDRRGETPLQLARRCHFAPMAELMEHMTGKSKVPEPETHDPA